MSQTPAPAETTRQSPAEKAETEETRPERLRMTHIKLGMAAVVAILVALGAWPHVAAARTSYQEHLSGPLHVGYNISANGFALRTPTTLPPPYGFSNIEVFSWPGNPQAPFPWGPILHLPLTITQTSTSRPGLLSVWNSTTHAPIWNGTFENLVFPMDAAHLDMPLQGLRMSNVYLDATGTYSDPSLKFELNASRLYTNTTFSAPTLGISGGGTLSLGLRGLFDWSTLVLQVPKVIFFADQTMVEFNQPVEVFVYGQFSLTAALGLTPELSMTLNRATTLTMTDVSMVLPDITGTLQRSDGSTVNPTGTLSIKSALAATISFDELQPDLASPQPILTDLTEMTVSFQGADASQDNFPLTTTSAPLIAAPWSPLLIGVVAIITVMLDDIVRWAGSKSSRRKEGGG